MDCTICAAENSRRDGFSARRAVGSAPGLRRDRRRGWLVGVPSGRAGSRGERVLRRIHARNAERSPVRWSTRPESARVRLRRGGPIASGRCRRPSPTGWETPPGNVSAGRSHSPVRRFAGEPERRVRQPPLEVQRAAELPEEQGVVVHDGYHGPLDRLLGLDGGVLPCPSSPRRPGPRGGHRPHRASDHRGHGRRTRRVRRPPGHALKRAVAHENEAGETTRDRPRSTALGAGGPRASRESSASDPDTSSAPAHGRSCMCKRRGGAMHTSAPGPCTPAQTGKPLRTNDLRPPDRGGQGRSARLGGAGSDPAVRGPATGSGPGGFAHPGPAPFGSLPAISPCGKANGAWFREVDATRGHSDGHSVGLGAQNETYSPIWKRVRVPPEASPRWRMKQAP